jgi:hypothetical protein
MGYLQTTTGITTVGPGATLSFTTPICAQLALQVSGSGSGNVVVEASLDGTNFVQITMSGGGILSSNSQSICPIAAIRYHVMSISGTLSISIAAAPLGSE